MQKLSSQTNALNWFEIPTTNINRARKFYETILGIQMIEAEDPNMKLIMFPFEPGSGKLSGGIVQEEKMKTSMDGTTVYLNGNPDMTPILKRVGAAGGKVLVNKLSIGNHGNIAYIQDTEGNKVGIHSMG